MNLEQAQSIIDKCVYATLAMVDENNTPYCLPLSIVRQGDFIYFHSARKGKKVDILRQNSKVCLSCVGDTSIPMNRFSIDFESAIVLGTVQELTEKDEKIEALRLLCERHSPSNMSQFDTEMKKFIAATSVWKIKIEEITAKTKLMLSQENKITKNFFSYKP